MTYVWIAFCAEILSFKEIFSSSLLKFDIKPTFSFGWLTVALTMMVLLEASIIESQTLKVSNGIESCALNALFVPFCVQEKHIVAMRVTIVNPKEKCLFIIFFVIIFSKSCRYMDYYHEIYAIISFCKDMIKIGQINNLRAVKKVDFGFYLDGEEFGEILLPTRYVPEGLVAGDDVEVFIYRDSEGRLIATTDRPLIEVGEFALLKVSAVNNVGAFMEIGVMKDLLVPYREQREPMVEGKSYVVYAYIDRTTNRIVGSTKLNKFVGNKVPKYSAGDSVKMIVVQKTDLGYKVIVDNLHWGMVYNNDVFDVVRIGDVLLGYV